MDNTKFRELADAVFLKIKDLDLASLPEDIAYQIVIEYISPACNQFQSCAQNLNDRDYELQEFRFKLTQDNFDLLVDYMVIQWLDSNYIKTTQALKPRLTSADFKSLNLPQSLGKAMELHSMLKKEADQLAINKSYRNSKLFTLVSSKKKV